MMKFDIGENVLTAFGPAIVHQCRTDGIIVAETASWMLANNTRVRLYLQCDSLKKALKENIDEKQEDNKDKKLHDDFFVHEQAGESIVKVFAKNENVDHSSTNSENFKPAESLIFLEKPNVSDESSNNNSEEVVIIETVESLKVDFKPQENSTISMTPSIPDESKDTDEKQNLTVGTIVSTLYGRGVIESIREDNVVIVKHFDWTLANNSTVRMFMNPSCLEPINTLEKETQKEETNQINQEENKDELSVGLVVSTLYGNGVIEEIRPDGVIVVKHIDWQLTNQSTVKLYMNRASVRPIVRKQSEEFSQPIENYFEKALRLKDEGKNAFREGQYVEAINKFLEALYYFKASEDENEEARKVLIQTHFNLCSIASKIKDYKLMLTHSTEVAELIVSIQVTRQPNSNVVERSVDEIMIFHEWPAKAIYNRTKARFHLHSSTSDDLLEIQKQLSEAHKLTSDHSTLGNMKKEIVNFIETVKKAIKETKEKEKKMWGDLFAKEKSRKVLSDSEEVNEELNNFSQIEKEQLELESLNEFFSLDRNQNNRDAILKNFLHQESTPNQNEHNEYDDEFSPEEEDEDEDDTKEDSHLKQNSSGSTSWISSSTALLSLGVGAAALAAVAFAFTRRK